MATATSPNPSSSSRCTDKVIADSVYCEANTTSNYVTILAIFDEPTAQLTPTSSSSASPASSTPAHVVEVTNFTAPPPKLAVAATPAMSTSSSSNSSQRRYVRNQNGRKSTDSGIPTRSVTLSPEIEKREMKLSQAESSDNPTTTLKRSEARKSRISEGFFDRFDELAVSAPSPATSRRSPLAGLIQSAANPAQTVVVLNAVGTSNEIGIDIVGVPHAAYPDRLQAVEILRIDPEGRVAEDGRLSVGDQLVEINERPIYQMSLARARAYIHELAAETAPTVTVDRTLESFAVPEKAVEMKPIISALQQANTKQLGATSTVGIVKGSAGLGFTIKSRETSGADGVLERLFYVGSVKTDCSAYGNLKQGDRLLEVNGTPTSGMKQTDIVALLKAAPLGESIELLISRIASSTDETAAAAAPPDAPAPVPSTSIGESERPPLAAPTSLAVLPKEGGNEQILDLEIPFNDTGSAGLGISLKARAIVKPDKTRVDCGIFVKNILTGGAAYKDGRLMISDQIIGIEDVDLTQFKNSDANAVIQQFSKRVAANVKTRRLRIRRLPPQDCQPNSSTVGVIDTTTSSAVTPMQSPMQPPQASRQNSQAGNDDARSEVSSMAGDSDHFARNNVTRKSISEKRRLGAANDPSHLHVFQQIKHQRQTSAPPGPLQTSASFTGGIASQASSTNRRHSRSFNAASRARHSSLAPLTATPELVIEKPVVEAADIPDEEPAGSMIRKRSASVESISTKKLSDSPGVHEMIGNGGAVQFVKQREVAKEPAGSMARRMVKEKQQRRKSIASIFTKKFFSKSRDTSPEKPTKQNEEYRRIPENVVIRERQAMTPPNHRNTINIEHYRNSSSDYPRKQKQLECATSPGQRVVANSVFYSERNSMFEDSHRLLRHRSQIHPQQFATATPVSRTLTAPPRRPTSIITMEPRTTRLLSPTSPRPSSSVLQEQERHPLPLRTSTPLLGSPHRWPQPVPTTTTPSTPGSRTADAPPLPSRRHLVTSATDPVLQASNRNSSSSILQQGGRDTTEHRHSRLQDEHSTIQYRRALQSDLRPLPSRLHTPTGPPPPLPAVTPATFCATAPPYTSIVSNSHVRVSIRARKQRAAGIRVFDVDKNEKPPILMRAKSEQDRPVSPSDVHIDTVDLNNRTPPQAPMRREAFRFSNRRESESRSKSQGVGSQRSRRRPTSEVLVFNENESPPAYC